MKDPLPRIRSRRLQFAIFFVLLLLLLALMKYPPLETVICALAFSALIMLGMRRHHQPLDCGAHEHQHRLCIRNLTLVIVLLVDGIYYLILRRENPAKLAGAEFDKDI